MKTKNETTAAAQELSVVLEHQLKNIWSQYTTCLDSKGSSEIADKLREQYFDLYQQYKNNKNWLKAIENN